MADQPDVVETFTEDHREIVKLIGLLERSGDARMQRALTDDLTIELVRHLVTEEQYLYPAVREHVPDGDVLADKQIAEHAEVEQLLKALEDVDVSDPGFPDAFSEITAKVESHVRETEAIFSLLQQHADATELGRLGTKVEHAKVLAPTRPHPAAPDTPPLNKIIGPGAGMVDRIRDWLSGRAH
jgi:hypothetical protein